MYAIVHIDKYIFFPVPVKHVEASVDVVGLLVSIYDVISVWLITDDSFVLGPCG